MRKLIGVLCLGLGLSGGLSAGAQEHGGAEADLDHLLSLLEGEFSNGQQMRFKDSGAAAAKTNHYELLAMTRVGVSAAGLPGVWLFAQTNKTDDNNRVYRQVLQEFFVDDDGNINSRVWKIADPALKDSGLPSVSHLEQLTKDQITQVLPDVCLTRWVRKGDQFVGTIDSDSCVIQSKYKSEQRRLFAEDILFDGGLWFREGAYSMTGELVFGLESDRYYRFQRISEPEFE